MTVPADVTFHAGWWHRYAGVNFTREFFEDPFYRIECDIKMRKLLYEKFGCAGLGEKDPKPRPIVGSDLIASGYLFSWMMGCEVCFAADAPPEVLCARLTDTQVGALRSPDITKNENWIQTMQQFETLEKRFGYVESHINLQGVQNLALDLRGSDLFIDYYESPEIAQKLIRVSTELMLEAGEIIWGKSKVRSHGVTAITAKVMPDVYLTSNCTVEMISGQLYEEFLLESDQMLADAFSPFGIHHCGQTMEHVVEGYKKVKGLAFAEVGAGSDILAVRKALPGVFLNLRYSPVKIKTATKEEMRKDIKEMSASAGSLFSVSCVGIDADTADSQVEAFLDCVKYLE